MLSEKKLLLRSAELLALASALASLWLALQSFRSPDPDFPVFLLASGGMALVMLTFLPACILGGEYVRTVKRPTTWRQRTEGLNPTDLRHILRWAPTIAGIAIAVALRFGSITLTDNRAATPEEVTASALYFTVFFLLALPVLASAARMPGTYAQSAA